MYKAYTACVRWKKTTATRGLGHYSDHCTGRAHEGGVEPQGGEEVRGGQGGVCISVGLE